MIWIDEYVDYFINRLSLLTLTDGSPIKVLYASPDRVNEIDADLKRPAITIFQYDEMFDIGREISDIRIKVSETPTEITVAKPPEVYKLYFQFCVMTDYKDQNVELSTKILQMFPPRGAIIVTDPVTIQQSDYDLIYLESFTDDDFLQGDNKDIKKRIFKKYFRYVIPTELPVNTTETYKKVLENPIVSVDNK